MYCKKDGYLLSDDAKFCPICRTPVTPMPRTGSGPSTGGAYGGGASGGGAYGGGASGGGAYGGGASGGGAYGSPSGGAYAGGASGGAYGGPSTFGGAPTPGGGAFGGISTADARKYLLRGSVGAAAIILAIVAIVFFVRLVSTIEDTIKLFSLYDGLASGLGIAGFIVCGVLLTAAAVLAAVPVARFALGNGYMGQQSIERGIGFSVALFGLCIVTWICKLVFHSPAGSNVSSILYTIFSTYGETATACFVPVIIAAVILYVVRVKFFSPAVRY